MTIELDAFVGRQAIFDRRLIVVGYELLFTKATAATMLDAFVALGLDALAGTLPVWVALPAELLIARAPIPLPPARTVIEVNAPVTPALIAALLELRGRGFRIALDDFHLTDATRPLLALAYCVKVNVLGVARDELARQFAALEHAGPILLAQNISTHDEHLVLRDLGFLRFQGHFLELPILSKAPRIPRDRAALLAILDLLYAPSLDVAALGGLETSIAAQPGLGVRLLASSAALSLGELVQRRGVPHVAALIVLIMVADFDDKPIELARQALIRARMCELLAHQAKLPPDQLFTAGLLSLLDAILDRPLHEIMHALDAAPLVREALDGGGSPAAKIVDTARHQNRGELHKVGAGFDAQAVFVAWFAAVRWAEALVSSV